MKLRRIGLRVLWWFAVLLACGVSFMAVRGYATGDAAYWILGQAGNPKPKDRVLIVGNLLGRIAFLRVDEMMPMNGTFSTRSFEPNRREIDLIFASPNGVTFAGFGYANDSSPSSTFIALMLPVWLPLILLWGFVIYLPFRQWRRRKLLLTGRGFAIDVNPGPNSLAVEEVQQPIQTTNGPE